MGKYSLTVEEHPSPRDTQIIIDKLYNYNRNQTQTKVKDVKRLAIFLRDSRNRVVGGILGWVYWDWLQIEFLWIQDDLRGKGYGKNLMVAAEKKPLQWAAIMHISKRLVSRLLISIRNLAMRSSVS